MKYRPMAKRGALLLLAALFFAGSPPQIPRTLHPDIRSLPDGSDGSPVFRPVKGLWTVWNGQYRQLSEEYDCGALYGRFLQGNVKISVRFRHLRGIPGAGLFFSSGAKSSTAFSHMVRLDGSDRILAGFFLNGEFTAQKVFPAHIDSAVWNRLVVDVDAGKRLYRVFLNGTPVGEALPLLFRAGYAGLQSSAGAVAFADFEVFPEKEPPRSGSTVVWPGRLELGAAGNLFVSVGDRNRIRVFSPAGEPLDEIRFGPAARVPVRSLGPFLPLPGGKLLVTDAQSNRLYRIGARGKVEAVAGAVGEFGRVVDLAYLSRARKVAVLDAEKRTVSLLDSTLRSAGSRTLQNVQKPLALTVQDSLLAVLDGYGPTVLLFRYRGKNLRFVRRFLLPFALPKDIVLYGKRLYALLGRKLYCVDLSGNLLRSSPRFPLENFWPVSFAVGGGGKVWLADYTGARLVATDTVFSLPEVSVKISAGKAAITWKSDRPLPGRLGILGKGQRPVTLREKQPAVRHRFVTAAPAPGGVFRFRILPSAPTLPAEESWSRWTAVRSPLPAGKKAVWRLPALVLLFANVLPDSVPFARAPAPLSPEEIRRIEAQMRDGARFYWIHSRMNLWVELHFLVLKRWFHRRQLVGPEWFYPPRSGIIDSVLAAAGRRSRDFPAIFYLIGLRKPVQGTSRWELAGRGGAFTNGISENGRYGISWWEVTHAHHASGNNWLMVHEFGHQLDDLFNASGYPDFWFNHFAPKLENVGPFGEHFDGNAYLIHLVPQPWWFELVRGDSLWVADADGDGIPDRAPELPLDERRLGSSPEKRDTDGDGLSDLQEVLLSNWITEGQGETYAHPLWPDLCSEDADSDGVPDPADANPLSPFPDGIRRGTPVLDGRISQGEWPFWVSLRYRSFSARVSAQWDSAGLYLALVQSDTVRAKIQIDARDDGWFCGDDNWIFTLSPRNPHPEVEARLFDASSFTEWPKMNPEKARQVAPVVRATHRGRKVWMECLLPREDRFGLNWSAGRRFGLNIGFWLPQDSLGRRRYVVIFEPNRFLHLRLVEQQNEAAGGTF